MILRLFGTCDVQIEGRPLPLLRSRKSLWLLAVLTLQHRHHVERAWLAGLLWPDSSHTQGLYNVRRALSELRTVLGPEAWRLDSPDHFTLRLDLTGAQADVAVFDAAIARGDEASLEGAVELYRGPLLEECHEEWILQERLPRAQAYLAALETLAARAEARGDPANAVRRLRQAAAADPLRETAQRGLLTALASSGDYTAALLAYRAFRDRLREEVQARPAPETEALFHRIREQARHRAGSRTALLDSTDSSVAPRHLPRPLSRFVGRETALKEVAVCLETARLVTLTGPGGVGKTRLAVQVADAAADDYRDGVWFVDLARLSDPALVPQAVAGALSVQERPDRRLTEALREFLRDRHLLLVLDNCEHVLLACVELVALLLSDCSQLRVLATSRQSLGLTGEIAWLLPGLSVPPASETVRGSVSGVRSSVLPDRRAQSAAPNRLLEYEAVRLFVERARGATPAFALTERIRETVVQICRRLDGIPLAIELAAARLRALSVEEIAARLDDHLSLLTGGSRTALPRHQTLRATMDWSYGLLSEAERLLLQRLSVFAGSFTLAAVEAVCSGCEVARPESAEISALHGPDHLRTPISALPTRDVLDPLAQLVDKSLVMVETHEGETRYRLLDTVRQYAGERLRAGGEEEAVRTLHYRFFHRLAEDAAPYLKAPEQAAPFLAGPDQVAWLDRLDSAHDDLRAALQWSLERAPEQALALAGTLVGFWEERRCLEEGRQWLARALEGAGKGRKSPAGAAALEGASALALLLEKRQAAREYLEESLAIRRELGDQGGTAASLAHLAHLAFLRDDYAAARTFYEESLAIHKERADRTGIATVLVGLGRTARREEDYSEARSLLDESLTLWRELGDRYGISQSLVGLGDVALRSGDVHAARFYYDEALTIQRELGDQAGIAGTLGELGNVAQQLGDYAQARRLREESLRIWRVLGSGIAVIHSLGAIGHLARDQGHYAEARSYYSESLVLRQKLGETYAIAQSLEDYAELAAHERQWARVTRLLGAAEALREVIGKPLLCRDRILYDQLLADARAALSEQTVGQAWAEGHAMGMEQAIAYAMEPAGSADAPRS